MIGRAISLDEPRRPTRPLIPRLVRGVAIVAAVGALAFAAQALRGTSARTVDGAFTLELASPRRTYLAGEAITGIAATLTYRGPAATRIGHAHGSPIGFGIVEPVNGTTLAPVWRLSCEVSTIDPAMGLTRDFGKSGASLTNDPAFAAFMEDPVLRLPAGTWHTYAEAIFGEGSCANPHDLRAEITLDVH